MDKMPKRTQADRVGSGRTEHKSVSLRQDRLRILVSKLTGQSTFPVRAHQRDSLHLLKLQDLLADVVRSLIGKLSIRRSLARRLKSLENVPNSRVQAVSIESNNGVRSFAGALLWTFVRIRCGGSQLVGS